MTKPHLQDDDDDDVAYQKSQERYNEIRRNAQAHRKKLQEEHAKGTFTADSVHGEAGAPVSWEQEGDVPAAPHRTSPTRGAHTGASTNTERAERVRSPEGLCELASVIHGFAGGEPGSAASLKRRLSKTKSDPSGSAMPWAEPEVTASASSLTTRESNLAKIDQCMLALGLILILILTVFFFGCCAL